MLKATFNSLEDLKVWWDYQPHPYWTLYLNQNERKSGSGSNMRNETLKDKDDAWEMLTNLIEMQTKNGGKFTILAAPRPKGNTGYTAYLTLDNSRDKSAINGLGNANAGIYGNATIDAAIQKAREDERRLVMLEVGLEQAEAALEEKHKAQGFWEQIGYLATNEPDKLANSFGQVMNTAIGGLAMLMGKFPMQAPATVQNVQNGPNVPNTPPTPSTEPAEPGELSDTSSEALNQIEQYMNLDEALPKLARLISTNPEQAKAILNQIQ